MLVAVGAAVVLPQLRSMKEGSAIARKEHDRFLAAAESSLDDFYIFDGVPDSSGKIADCELGTAIHGGTQFISPTCGSWEHWRGTRSV
jgi:hypothetical protein